MSRLKKRIENLEHKVGGISADWQGYLPVWRYPDGRIQHEGQFYADTDALLDALGIIPGTKTILIFGVAEQEPYPREKSTGENHADGQETPQDPVDSLECVVGHPVPETAICNPFMRPMPEHLKPRQTHAIMPKSLFGRDSVFGNYAAPYWRD